MPSSQEITELIADIDDNITHLQYIRDDATTQIHKFMDVRAKLIDTYMNETEDA